MNILKIEKHCEVSSNSKIIIRDAARAICIKDNKILLLYTGRYDDYSLPGGGIDNDESKEEGLVRELIEETGANNITKVKAFGIYEEYRPWTRDPGFDVQHMISYCFTCEVDLELGDTNYESYEINNKMKPLWINIDEAISHNENIILNSPKVGLSIQRETFLLKLIKEKLY